MRRTIGFGGTLSLLLALGAMAGTCGCDGGGGEEDAQDGEAETLPDMDVETPPDLQPDDQPPDPADADGDTGDVEDEDQPPPSEWEQVGGAASPTDEYAEDPKMMIVAGSPVVGYRYQSFQTSMNVWDGSSWGTPVPDPTEALTDPSMYRAPDFCSDGSSVVLAYGHMGDSTAIDDAFYERIFARRWTEADGWEILNGGAELSVPWDPAIGGADADEASVDCLPGGNPVVGWLELEYVAGHDDDAWVATFSGDTATRSTPSNRVATLGTSVRTTDVAATPDGDVVLAVFEHTEDASFRTGLFVSRYDGSFTDLGDVVDEDANSNDLSAPSLAYVSDSEVYVAYSTDRDDEGVRDVFVQVWDGDAWRILGDGPVSALGTDHYDSANPDLLLVEGTLFIAWEESGNYGSSLVFVARWDGAAWALEGEGGINVDLEADALDPSLAWDAAAGYIYAAFEEYTEAWATVYVKRRLIGE